LWEYFNLFSSSKLKEELNLKYSRINLLNGHIALLKELPTTSGNLFNPTFFREHSNQSERQSKCLLNANRHLNLANICHITSGKLSSYKLQQLEVIALELKARLLESLETKVGQSKCGLK